MKLTLMALALTASVWSSPIGVSGGGSGECGFNFPDNFGSWTAAFSGPGVSVFITDFAYIDGCGPTNSGLTFTTGGLRTGHAFIGTLDSTNFTVRLLGDNPGFLTLFDISHNVLASVDLVGYVQITSSVTIDCGVSPSCTDTKSQFIITSVPEPATWLLTAVGLGLPWRKRSAARAGLLPRLQPEQLDEVRAVMLANNGTVMAEMARRALAKRTNRSPRSN
jgi:hypothetical protein